MTDKSGMDEYGAYDMVSLSMVKGGQPKPFKVHRKPRKHIILDQNITPRGWYKAKHEPDRVRPRPCYSEAVLTTPYGGHCPVNCTFCLDGDALVGTPEGGARIEELRKGDVVWGRTNRGIEYSDVLGTFDRMVESYYVLKLDTGTELKITGDHPVYVVDRGWVVVEDLREEERLESLQLVRGSVPISDQGQTLLRRMPQNTEVGIGRKIQCNQAQKVQGVGYTTVMSLRRVDEPLRVYDIQTTTENFYASGLLVHNCYVNNGTRGYRATGLPTVDPHYPDKMAKRVAKMMVSGAGYITSFTEPFHPLEDTYHITQRLSQMFADEGLPLFYCTRKLPADWAIDLLLENPYSYIQWSVNTSNADDCKRMSPGMARLDDILDDVEYLSGEGIYTSFQCNPIHPGITSLEELILLIDLAADAGLDHIIFKFVEQVSNNRKIIIERLRQRKFPSKKVDTFDSLFNQVIGGVYTIQQDVRIEWLNVLLKATRAAGVSMSLCYEYYNNGKAGANLAPWYTTSDQCHGRGVPVYYRPEPGAPFQPFPCYRKGCLYCEDYGTCACDNDELLAAKALQYKDLRALRIYEPTNGWDWDWPESCARPDDAALANAINPGWQTDAELWNWPSLEEVLCAGS